MPVGKTSCRFLCICAAFGISCALPIHADQNYSQQVFFQNSNSPGSYFYSKGKVTGLSSLTLEHGKLPVETVRFVSAPNALSLKWSSVSQGSWEVDLTLYQWRNRYIDFPGNNLFLWVYAEKGIAAADMPLLTLRDTGRNFTKAVSLGKYTHGVPPGKWIRLRIPGSELQTASLHPFQFHRTAMIVLSQNSADAQPHTMLMDDIRIEDDPMPGQTAPAAPRGVRATAYERHVDITWQPVANDAIAQYVIYRSERGGPYRAVGVQRAGVNRFCDYLGDDHTTASYRVTARTSSLLESPMSGTATATTHPMTDEQLLTMVQEASFRYYWEADEPHSGMTRENTPGNDDIIATGASGFGVMALIVGVQRGFIPRQQAVERLLRITAFLQRADRFHGAWPHFLSGSTGHALPVFGMYDNGADLVETSFLIEGLLSARQYFKGDSAQEKQLYQRITSLWEGVDWEWFRATPRRDALYWHWSPDYTWYISNRLTGWNEVMITYLLAIASPTHGVPAGTYYTGWVGESIGNPYRNGKTYYGIPLEVGQGTGGPLFFTDYSYMGFDPHGLQDRYANYFQNNRHMAQINHAYCVANPDHWKGYGDADWGLTAVDGPAGYSPYEPTPSIDDGTIAPTGAISAFAYTPQLSMLALKHFYRDLGASVWSIYGFRDAFNLQQNWYSGITMGLNQAPMAVMIENQRSGVVWKSFMENPEIVSMLQRIGFHRAGE